MTYHLRIVDVEPAEDIAVRLTVDTEVVVAPKTRYGPKMDTTERHDLAEASTSSSDLTQQLSPDVLRATRQLLRLLPESFFKDSDMAEKGGQVAHVAPYHYSLLIQAFPSTRAVIKVKTCPSLQHSANASTDATPNHEKGKEKELPEGTTVSEILVYLHPHVSVPPNTVWLSKAARQGLRLQDTAFELLQLAAITRSTDRNAHTIASSESEIEPSPIAGETKGLTRGELAGFDKQVAKSLKFIEQSITGSHLESSSRTSLNGLLICGAAGSGKTALIEQVARKAQFAPGILARTQYVKCAQLVNMRIPQLKSRLEDEFTAAAWHAPSILVFDDLDHLIPAEVEHIDSFRSLHMANLFIATAAQASRNGKIVIVATAKAPETLHAQLAQSHFFTERITLLAPDKEARKEILSTVAKSKIATSPDIHFAEDFNFASIAAQTDGYLPVDLRDLVDRALHQAAIRAGKSGRVTLDLSLADVRAAQADFTPLSLRDVKLQKSEVEWSDIGGLQETRRVLRETLEWPTKYSAIFASSPLRLRSGYVR